MYLAERCVHVLVFRKGAESLPLFFLSRLLFDFDLFLLGAIKLWKFLPCLIGEYMKKYQGFESRQYILLGRWAFNWARILRRPRDI